MKRQWKIINLIKKIVLWNTRELHAWLRWGSGKIVTAQKIQFLLAHFHLQILEMARTPVFVVTILKFGCEINVQTWLFQNNLNLKTKLQNWNILLLHLLGFCDVQFVELVLKIIHVPKTDYILRVPVLCVKFYWKSKTYGQKFVFATNFKLQTRCSVLTFHDK